MWGIWGTSSTKHANKVDSIRAQKAKQNLLFSTERGMEGTNLSARRHASRSIQSRLPTIGFSGNGRSFPVSVLPIFPFSPPLIRKRNLFERRHAIHSYLLSNLTVFASINNLRSSTKSLELQNAETLLPPSHRSLSPCSGCLLVFCKHTRKIRVEKEDWTSQARDWRRD